MGIDRRLRVLGMSMAVAAVVVPLARGIALDLEPGPGFGLTGYAVLAIGDFLVPGLLVVPLVLLVRIGPGGLGDRIGAVTVNATLLGGALQALAALWVIQAILADGPGSGSLVSSGTGEGWADASAVAALLAQATLGLGAALVAMGRRRWERAEEAPW